MPPPKIIGQVLQKKNIVKEIQRRKKKKKQCSQRKKKHFFVWNSGCLHNKVFPWGSPEGQKKNKVTFPVKFKLVPLVLLLYERKKAYLQQVHVVKALLLTYSNPPRGARNNWRKFVFCLNQVYKKNQCLLLPWISVSKKRTTVNSLSWNSYKSVKQKNYD